MLFSHSYFFNFSLEMWQSTSSADLGKQEGKEHSTSKMGKKNGEREIMSLINHTPILTEMFVSGSGQGPPSPSRLHPKTDELILRISAAVTYLRPFEKSTGREGINRPEQPLA